MSVMLRVIGAGAHNCSAGRQHAARHHEAHRGASRLLTATEKGGGVHACVHAASVYLCWPEVLNAGAAAGSRRAAEEAGGAGEEGRRAGPAGEGDADAERVRRWALCRGRHASGSWSVSFRAARSLASVSGRKNNWPPLPEKFPVGPCFYHDITVDIPVEYQKTVQIMYYLWMCEWLLLSSSRMTKHLLN